MLMNRIAPSASDLYTANADGSSERKFLDTPAFDYNATFAADGQSIVFTSERNGDGNSDVIRCRVDGTGIQTLVTGGGRRCGCPFIGWQACIRLDARRLSRQRLGDGPQ
jgi:Tol biopolymer transport system component